MPIDGVPEREARADASRFLLLVLGLCLTIGCDSKNGQPISVDQFSTSFGTAGRKIPLEESSEWVGPSNYIVADGIYLLGEMSPSAVYAIDTGQGIILIDSGVDESGRELRENMLQVGLALEDVRYVLITHAHYDHVFGANRVREVSGAQICAGRGEASTLQGPNQNALFSIFPRQAFSGKPIRLDRQLDDGDVIQLGDSRIRVMATPGHTPGSLCYLLEKDERRILFTGDTIASVKMGPATYPVDLSPQYRGDPATYLETVESLLKMKPPDLLLPGHPRQQDRFQSLALDRKDWDVMLRSARSELENVVRRHRQDGRDTLDGIAKEIESGLFYLGELDSVAVYAWTSGGVTAVVNAPGGKDFADFLSVRFKELGIASESPDVVLLTSVDERFSSGVNSLPSQTRIVSSRDGVAESANEFGKASLRLGGALVETIPLTENGRSAYVVMISGRRLLLTPDVPRNVAVIWRDRANGAPRLSSLEPQANDLITELAASTEAMDRYENALEKIRTPFPDVWLPAVPMSGQNANLYSDQWRFVMLGNERAINIAIKRRARASNP